MSDGALAFLVLVFAVVFAGWFGETVWPALLGLAQRIRDERRVSPQSRQALTLVERKRAAWGPSVLTLESRRARMRRRWRRVTATTESEGPRVA
jgi:hypothetical protein